MKKDRWIAAAAFTAGAAILVLVGCFRPSPPDERADRFTDETVVTANAIPAAAEECPDGKCPQPPPPPPSANGRLTVIPLPPEPVGLMLGAGAVKQARTVQDFSMEAEIVFTNGQTRRETVYIPAGSTITPPIRSKR